MKCEVSKQLQAKIKNRRSKEIVTGDIVLVLYPLKKKDHRKQRSPLCGPYRVLETLKKKVTVRTFHGKKEYPVHIRRCRKLSSIFFTEYIHWLEQDAQELLTDPELNMSDIQPWELEDFPELKELFPSDISVDNGTHIIDKCDDYMDSK